MTGPALAPDALALMRHDMRSGRRVGLAVSGGSDSTALLVLAIEALGPEPLVVLSFDHRLREGSAAELGRVADFCAGRGIAHRTLIWTEGAGPGNLADAARRARYEAVARAARLDGCETVALGHTRDDQAETVLMGLARNAGLEGLCGMRPSFRQGGIRFLRPILHESRATLRRMLVENGIGWSDDPTNADPAYLRTRARTALAALGDLGIDAASLAGAAERLADTRNAIARLLSDWAMLNTRQEGGDLLIDTDALATLAPDMQRRVMGSAILWLNGATYAPRAPALLRLAQAGDGTLAGVRVLADRGALRLTRELAAVGPDRPWGQVWDGRWRISGPGGAGMRIGALGAAGLRDCPGWRETGMPRATLMASPALRDDRGGLIAAPLAGWPNGFTARLAAPRDHFPRWMIRD
ncbi:tRNA lysidine(34) synthetase TilS [Palleronia sediminis]|uniref:tRNA(Ile)-lysidine synthase n=1 Tax=Palleronia sediminis TaxID=2547833 RepID=A0A4R6A6A7_9RHOB|nr:tRNA lysidine(34) synthetase TilS [Palleronia sediminis]TDL76333.1 tRNA lysidine(34) synthetase TilS [Palleronia sediminis]